MTRRWLDQAPPSREAEDVQRLLRGLDAEPPPGASERVWRRGVGPAARAARPERPRWLLAVGALATAALAVALWPRALEAPAGAQVIAVRGEAYHDASARAVSVGQSLALGSALRVEAGARVTLRLDGTELALEGPAEVRLDAAELTLDAGRLEIAPAARALAIVAAPWRAELAADASAVLMRDSRGALTIEARTEGVRVRGPEPEQALAPGQRWSRSGRPGDTATRASAVQLEPTTDEGRALDAPIAPAVVTAPAATAERGARAPAAGPVRRGATPREARSPGDGGERSAARIREGVRGGTDAVVARASDDRRGAPEARPRATDVETERPAPGAAVLPTAPVPPAVSATPAIPERWDEDLAYRRARAERDPQAALALYDALIAHRGALAPAASLQAAELQLRQGAYEDAHRRYTALLAEAPRGPLAPEAHLGAVEALVRLGRLDAAREALDAAGAADRALAASPELAFLRAELARRAGRCEDAVPDYRRAKAGRSADDAAYNLAWCLLTLDEDEGRVALRAYLEQHPQGRHADKARARLHSTKKE